MWVKLNLTCKMHYNSQIQIQILFNVSPRKSSQQWWSFHFVVLLIVFAKKIPKHLGGKWTFICTTFQYNFKWCISYKYVSRISAIWRYFLVWLSSPPWKSNVLGWFNQWLKGFKKWVSSISFDLSMRLNSWRMELTQPSTSIPCNLFMFRFMITFTSCLTMGKPHKWGTCPKCRLELAIAVSYASYFKNVPTLALYATHNILIPNHPSEACDA